MLSPRARGLICAASVAFIWTGFQLFSRLSAAQSFTMWDVAGLRYLGAFLTILPFAWLRGLPRLPLRRTLTLTATAAFGFALGAYAGFQLAPAAQGAVIMAGLLPFLIATVWWIGFGERWGWRRAASLLLVAAGILLLAQDVFGHHPGAWRGNIFFMCAVASWAAYTYFVRRWGIGALDATLAVALYAAPIYLPVWHGSMSVVVAGFLYTRATVLLGGPQTSAVTAAVPAMVALSAWWLLGEALGPAGWAGVAIVTLGMIAGVGAAARPAR